MARNTTSVHRFAMQPHSHDPRFDPPEEQFAREREKSRARRTRRLALLLMLASGLVMDALGELHGRGRFTLLAAGLAFAIVILAHALRAKADEADGQGPYSEPPHIIR